MRSGKHHTAAPPPVHQQNSKGNEYFSKRFHLYLIWTKPRTLVFFTLKVIVHHGHVIWLPPPLPHTAPLLLTYLIISNKNVIYDAMSRKSAHLSISRKSPQCKFWHVCHQYFISEPPRIFLVLTSYWLMPNHPRSIPCLFQGPFSSDIQPDPRYKLTHYALGITRCVQTWTFCVSVGMANAKCDLHYICRLTGQCTCTALRGSPTVLCLCKAAQCMCARHRRGSAPAAIWMNHWIIHSICFSVNMERENLSLLWSNFNFVITQTQIEICTIFIHLYCLYCCYYTAKWFYWTLCPVPL